MNNIKQKVQFNATILVEKYCLGRSRYINQEAMIWDIKESIQDVIEDYEPPEELEMFTNDISNFVGEQIQPILAGVKPEFYPILESEMDRSNPPNLTMEFLEKYPEKRWDWRGISHNLNLTMEPYEICDHFSYNFEISNVIISLFREIFGEKIPKE